MTCFRMPRSQEVTRSKSPCMNHVALLFAGFFDTTVECDKLGSMRATQMNGLVAGITIKVEI
jgi:hypothetical protein